jgi:hypothetical protein
MFVPSGVYLFVQELAKSLRLRRCRIPVTARRQRFGYVSSRFRWDFMSLFRYGAVTLSFVLRCLSSALLPM